MLAQVIFFWRKLLRFLRAYLAPRPRQGLAEMVDEARRTWREALNEYNFVDQEMIDYMIFKINAAERRFVALWREARRRGVTAWPPDLPGPVPGVHDARAL